MAALQDAVFPEEIEYFIQSLRCFPVKDVGTTLWFDCHEKVIKLSQQAILEASSCREEVIKEFLVLHQKLNILVHEAFCILIWRVKVLPRILDIDPNPPASFLLYAVLFHEAAVIALLETVLYHQNGCESLQEFTVDLVDYTTQAVIQLIGLVNTGYLDQRTKVDVNESTQSELERQQKDLLYKIGIRCISILSYLADSPDKIPLSAIQRMITVYDLPCLLSEILHLKPWLRRTNNGFEKFINEKWTQTAGEELAKITKAEAQTWFCFRQLLLNRDFKSYEINDYRKEQLSKCAGLLNETVLDQLAPLVQFKHFLSTLCISSSNANTKAYGLVMEEVPQIKTKIIKDAEDHGGFEKIAKEQTKIFLTGDKDELIKLASRINIAYNTDLLAEMEMEDSTSEENQEKNKSKCGNCRKSAQLRCSNCLTVYYCSRNCQKEDWSDHKKICQKPTATS